MKVYLKILNTQKNIVEDAEIVYENQDNQVSSEFRIDSTTYKFQGMDIYECFQYYKGILERNNCIIMCNGSRVDVRPSGMLRDMSNGFKVYHLVIGQEPSIILDLFEFTDENLGFREEQEKYFKKWKASLPAGDV